MRYFIFFNTIAIMATCTKAKIFFNMGLILLFSSSIFGKAKDLPLAIRHLKCEKTNTNACFKEMGNKAIPLIAQGDPEYDIPNMIPYKIPSLNLISTPNLHLNLFNIEVYGLEKMKIIDDSMDDKNHIYVVTLNGQNITIVGDYAADGKILVMPLQGKGKFTFYFKNGIYNNTIYSSIIEKEGDLYYKPIDNRLRVKFEKIEMKLENLFNGDKKLGDQVNAFLNENWEPLIDDFGPTIEKTVAKMVKRLFVNIAARVPLKNIYL